MVVVQASKLTLPNPSSLSSPPQTTSILFEPTSLSLALTHSDSSLSLYPSFTPLSPSSPSPLSLPTPQTLIPSPSSSSTFLLLQSPTNPNSTPRVLFIVAGPHRSQILLRFYILHPKTNAFARPRRVLCSHKDLRFEPKLGVLVNSKHGVSIKLTGSVNYFAMYSVSSAKVWVFAAKAGDDDEGGGGGGDMVKLMRCAVIECSRPVWSVSVSFGFLLLGEENGVRVFGLRRLVKGRVKKVRNVNSKLPNGVVAPRDFGKHGGRDRGGKRYYSVDGVLEETCNGDLEGKIEKHGVAVSQTVWISDGCHSVHMFTTMDVENALNEADGNEGDEKLMHIPVIRVLFSSEKIQDVISLASNSILILGQGSLYAYAIS